MIGEKDGSPFDGASVTRPSPTSNEPRPIMPETGASCLWKGMYSPSGTRWTLS